MYLRMVLNACCWMLSGSSDGQSRTCVAAIHRITIRDIFLRGHNVKELLCLLRGRTRAKRNRPMIWSEGTVARPESQRDGGLILRARPEASRFEGCSTHAKRRRHGHPVVQDATPVAALLTTMRCARAPRASEANPKAVRTSINRLHRAVSAIGTRRQHAAPRVWRDVSLANARRRRSGGRRVLLSVRAAVLAHERHELLVRVALGSGRARRPWGPVPHRPYRPGRPWALRSSRPVRRMQLQAQ